MLMQEPEVLQGEEAAIEDDDHIRDKIPDPFQCYCKRGNVHDASRVYLKKDRQRPPPLHDEGKVDLRKISVILCMTEFEHAVAGI